MQSIPTRLDIPLEQWHRAISQFACELRVAVPGIIQSFDAAKQTVTVKVALRENLNLIQKANGRMVAVTNQVEIPELLDIPIVIPRAGGYALTLPVQAGDECLVIFGDMCIDAWWQSGGVQNQIDKRRHDLSDGFAVLGCWSQPRTIEGYSSSSAQLRTEDGMVTVEIAGNAVNVSAPTVNVTAPTVNVSGSDAVNITGGNCSIDGKKFLNHKHSDPQGGLTGVVA